MLPVHVETQAKARRTSGRSPLKDLKLSAKYL